MRGIYSGRALINKRLAVRPHEQSSDIHCIVHAPEVFFPVYSSPSPLSSYP